MQNACVADGLPLVKPRATYEATPKFSLDILPEFLAKEYRKITPEKKAEGCVGNRCLGSNGDSKYSSLKNPNLEPHVTSMPPQAPSPMAEKVGDGNMLYSIPIIGNAMRKMGMTELFFGY
ncbi:hypothetical protein L0F63_003092 [Massospora cicadina]|nr:hypothetical protein L0F63_003092 [Massospora cicadina]